MKSIYFLSLIFSLLTLNAKVSQVEDAHSNLYLEDLEKFEDFEKEYERTYASEAERQKRLGIFRENLRKIEGMQKSRTFRVGINNFTDMTWEEFKESHLMEAVHNELNG